MILSTLFWFAFALVLAGLEVEAEGRHGWAEKMPTWYRTTGIAGRFYSMLMGGKPLTGYHAWMFLMPLIAVHSGFFLGAKWTFAVECVVIARYLALAALWDFLWFVINPHYTLGNFTKQSVWWHAKSPWILGLPLDYYVGWGMSLAFAGGATFLGKPDALRDQGALLIGMALLTCATVIAAPVYHIWYWQMRQRDDRDDAIPHRKHH